ncbi:uncharacterized protein LOC130053938 isoform X1 [Ostrea edulis]|uniref:uncharacterized protein LOC130053938 isoform X1 n=2 Tax=Ostrea edulis TaxID=37623 RepID=UPI0024AED83A|nr:uncharacterized protein LOC130053938 isoform X1 [Ostrea edulis]
MYQCNLTVCLAIILPCSQLYLYLFDCQLYEMKPFFSYTKCWKSTKFDKSPEQLLNDSLSWLYESVEACNEQCKKLVKALCQLCPGRIMRKGTSSILGHKISILFKNHIKAMLKELLGLKKGNSRCYEQHWRHVRWIKRQPLNEHLEMKNSEKGMEERIKLFGKGRKELYALILEEFGVFKPKSIIRIGYCNDFYLSLKENSNELLMATLEDEMGQNMNTGVQYFKDVLFVEAEILIASIVWDTSLKEAECRLYPMK